MSSALKFLNFVEICLMLLFFNFFFLILKTLLENDLQCVDLVGWKTALAKVQFGFYGQISI